MGNRNGGGYSRIEMTETPTNAEYGQNTNRNYSVYNSASSAGQYYTTTETEIHFTEKGQIVFGCICIFISISLILLFSSLNYVKYDQYALEKYRFGAVSSKPILSQGVYITTPFIDLVYFEETYIPFDFVAPVFSDTGMEFDMTILAYCKILPENLYRMYDMYSTDYKQRAEYTIKNAVKNKASLFSVNDFLTNRPLIENVTALKVFDDVKDIVGLICPISLFKITNIKFPDNIIQYALQSAIALQNNQIATNQQEVDVYIVNTNQQVAQINAESKLILQQSIYDSAKIVALAQYNYNNRVNSARGVGISNFAKKIGIDSSDMNEFIEVLALLENTNKTIFSGLDGVSMIINQ